MRLWDPDGALYQDRLVDRPSVVTWLWLLQSLKVKVIWFSETSVLKQKQRLFYKWWSEYYSHKRCKLLASDKLIEREDSQKHGAWGLSPLRESWILPGAITETKTAEREGELVPRCPTGMRPRVWRHHARWSLLGISAGKSWQPYASQIGYKGTVYWYPLGIVIILRPGFDSYLEINLFLLHSVQNASGSHLGHSVSIRT